jgi:hypothetical protein
VRSLHDTPSVIAAAASSAASRPCAAVAWATTAVAVVPKKIHAPGFRITETTPRAVGPSSRRPASPVVTGAAASTPRSSTTPR